MICQGPGQCKSLSSSKASRTGLIFRSKRVCRPAHPSQITTNATVSMTHAPCPHDVNEGWVRAFRIARPKGGLQKGRRDRQSLPQESAGYAKDRNAHIEPVPQPAIISYLFPSPNVKRSLHCMRIFNYTQQKDK